MNLKVSHLNLDNKGSHLSLTVSHLNLVSNDWGVIWNGEWFEAATPDIAQVTLSNYEVKTTTKYKFILFDVIHSIYGDLHAFSSILI